MNSELDLVLSDLRSLATRRGWSEVGAAIDEVERGQASSRIVVAAANAVDASRFQAWVADSMPGSRIEFCRLESLATDPLPALAADKAVAIFECGRLLEAEEVDAVIQAFFSRPPASYAIVLDGADRIANEAETNMVERGAWRLLVPDPKPDWAGQDLLEHYCYLWTAGPTAEFLSPRVRRDREALAAWLAAPAEPGRDLERQRALYAIELADEQRAARERPVKPDASVRAQQIFKTREAMMELRRRLLRRLDADMSSMERQLAASLQTLQQDLLEGLGPCLRKTLPRTGSFSEDGLRRVLSEYISEGASRWKHETEHLLLSRKQEVRSDAEELLRSIDWSLINQVASKPGDLRQYPDALLREWAVEAAGEYPFPADERGADDVDPPALRRIWALPNVLRIAAVGAVALVVKGLFSLVPAGVVAAALAAAIAKGHVEQNLREAETHGQAVIKAIIRTAISSAREETRQAIQPIRQRLFDGLKAVEAMLDQALGEARAPASESASESDETNSDGALLDAYRRRALAAGSVV